MRAFRPALIGVIALSSVLIGIKGVGTAHAYSTFAYNGVCYGGPIAPGNYLKLTVYGNCFIPSGTVTVHSDLVVAPGASLFAAIPTATVAVIGNIDVQRGASLFLGCSPAFGCNTTTNDSVGGSVEAVFALGVILHSDRIGGSVALNYGGGGVNCTGNALYQGPVFSDIEDDTIGGGVSIIGLQTCWFGLFRDNIVGNVFVAANRSADPDSTEIASNYIAGNLACFANTPPAQVGDSGGQPNTVSGSKTGECANL